MGNQKTPLPFWGARFPPPPFETSRRLGLIDPIVLSPGSWRSPRPTIRQLEDVRMGLVASLWVDWKVFKMGAQKGQFHFGKLWSSKVVWLGNKYFGLVRHGKTPAETTSALI